MSERGQNGERFLHRNSLGDEFGLQRRGRKVWFYAVDREGRGAVFGGPATLRKIAKAILKEVGPS